MAVSITGHLTQSALSLIKEMESCRLDAYRDAVGVWTIGYGHTGGVRAGSSITMAQAQRFLINDIKVAQKDIARCVKVPLTDNEYGALVSLVFNIGGRAFKRSTCLNELNRGNRQAAGTAMELFVKGRVRGRKRVLNGLVRRRRLERALFETRKDVLHEDGLMSLGGETIQVFDTDYDSGRRGLDMAPVAVTPANRVARDPQLRRKLRRSTVGIGAGAAISAAPVIVSAGFPDIADRALQMWDGVVVRQWHAVAADGVELAHRSVHADRRSMASPHEQCCCGMGAQLLARKVSATRTWTRR